MLKRVLSGLGIAAVLLVLFLYGNAWVLVGLSLVVHLGAQDEFRRLARSGGIPTEAWAVPLCGVAYLLAAAVESTYFQSRLGDIEDGRVFLRYETTISALVLWLAPLLLLMIGVLRRRTEQALERFAVSLAAFWYTAVLPAFLLRTVLAWDMLAIGRVAIVYALVVIKMSDAGAYFMGMRFGRHGPLLIPAISPAKSVIGLLGGYAFGLASSLLFALGAAELGGGAICGFRIPYVHAAVLGILLPTIGCVGDLAESLIKRSVRVKDSASRVPGLGGLLDMLDSPVFAAPIFYLYVRRFLMD